MEPEFTLFMASANLMLMFWALWEDEILGIGLGFFNVCAWSAMAVNVYGA